MLFNDTNSAFHYPFPAIYNIEQIRKAIAGRSEFIEKDCGDHIVIKYVVNFADTFPPVHYRSSKMAGPRWGYDPIASLRRECRGIAFDKETGNIIRRPPHKFFNLDERPETNKDQVKRGSQFVVLEKEDGSCVTPYRTIAGRLIWGTPFGETEFSPFVEQFVSTNTHYSEVVNFLIDVGWTPTFEYCSRRNRVVLDHPKERLVLTCVRNMISGEYMPYRQMEAFAEYGIEVVKCHSDEWEIHSQVTLNQAIEFVTGKQQTEGVIIRFDDGHMLKLKTEWYCALHGAVTGIRFEKDVLKIILADALDDLKPHLTQDWADRIEEYARDVHDGFFTVAGQILDIVETNRHLTKKEFAAMASVTYSKPLFSHLCSMFDKKDDLNILKVYDYIRAYVSVPEKLGSQSWIDRHRFLYDNKRFDVHEGFQTTFDTAA